MSSIFKTKNPQPTSLYGPRQGGFHRGIDLVGEGSTFDYVVALEDGCVCNTRTDCTGYEPNGSYGNFVHIDHRNGLSTLYAHLAPNTVCVTVGQVVKKGQVIGYMGNTGHSLGAHVHFEVRECNNPIDPTEYALYNKPIITKPEYTKCDTTISVNADNTMRLRKEPSLEASMVGFASKGTYTATQQHDDGGYIWYNIPQGWIALLDPYVTVVTQQQQPEQPQKNRPVGVQDKKDDTGVTNTPVEEVSVWTKIIQIIAKVIQVVLRKKS